MSTEISEEDWLDRPPPEPDVFYVYKFYDEADTLIYVGTSKNGLRRLYYHHLDKSWFGEVVTVRLERYATNEESLNREATLAMEEEPRHNYLDQFRCRYTGVRKPSSVPAPAPQEST